MIAEDRRTLSKVGALVLMGFGVMIGLIILASIIV
jgi:hypothetical protein